MWAICGRTAGVITFDKAIDPQSVVLDVMPLNTGFLPVPLVRLSKYIPAESATPGEQSTVDYLQSIFCFSISQ